MSGSRDIFNPHNPLVLSSENSRNAVVERDEEQLLLQEDIAGMKKQPKRNQINLAYGSDSSEDEFETKARNTKNGNKANMEDGNDDDDMFGGSDEESEQKEENHTIMSDSELQRPNPEDDNGSVDGDESSDDEKVEFMDINEFEKAESLDSLPTLDENPDDLDDTEVVNIKYYIDADNDQMNDYNPVKRIKEPQMEAFSLRNDLEEGKFDIDGNFIRNEEDPEAHKDNWLASIDKRNIINAKNAQMEREISEGKAFQEMQTMSLVELIAELLSYLEVGETPMEALQRYGLLAKGNKLKNRNKNRRNRDQGMEIDESEKNKRALIKQTIDRVTYCTDQLLQKRINDIYELTKEELLRLYQRETGESYLDLQRTKRKRSASPEPQLHIKDTNIQWEFKWEGAEEVHGPYDGALMQAWAESHFDDRVTVRRVNDIDFLPYKDVKFI